MKIYDYLAFSIYGLLKIIFKRDIEQVLLRKTSFIITLIILLLSYTIKGIFELNGYDDTVVSGVYIFLIILLIWIPNYIYLSKRKFLENDFEFTRKNIIQVIVLVLTVFIAFMIIANKNRERIFRKRGYSQEVIDNGGKEPFNPNKKPESLEEDIRLWYYNTFEKKDSIDKK